MHARIQKALSVTTFFLVDDDKGERISIPLLAGHYRHDAGGHMMTHIECWLPIHVMHFYLETMADYNKCVRSRSQSSRSYKCIY